jgi:hypothetical protein
VAVDHGQVTFTLKNYSSAGQREQMTLEAVEFIRRFLLHVLPQAFTRIRHFGLCAGRNVQTKLQTARTVLTALTPAAHCRRKRQPAMVATVAGPNRHRHPSLPLLRAWTRWFAAPMCNLSIQARLMGHTHGYDSTILPELHDI